VPTKTVKLEQEVYDELEKFRDKRETFSQAIGTLLGARIRIWQLVDVLEGSLRFQELKAEKLTKLAAAMEDEKQ